ncbi:MAG: SDR family NAD(P)-dependent oxidoreductase [Halioglobus sp.]|nr:SDR family NAD(P)-dependent oxidoreductase [Halioglobus sp.]
MDTKVALVTGAASGMGKICAVRLAQRGVQVAAIDRSADGLAELAQSGDNIHPHTCDVSDGEQLRRVVANVAENLGEIDRLVHCAAIFPTGKLDSQDEADIHRLMAVNYGGTVNAVRAVLPQMQARDGGEIVVFGSIGGAVPVPECGAYCATKAAVNFFTEVLIEENRHNGVHILLVCPPLVDTPLLQQATATGDPKMVRDSIATRRFADPEDIIDAVESALASGRSIIYPQFKNRVVAWLRRFSPRLMWRVLYRASGI